MTIFQSDWGKGLQTPPRPQSAGAVHVAKFKYLAITTLASTDIIEIGVLPAFASISDAILVTEGVWTGITADIGIMSGTVGDELSARTSGSELFAAAPAFSLRPPRSTARSVSRCRAP